MDGWVRVLRPFNSISVISRRWKDEHERLCAMKRRSGSGRISPPAGFEPATPWNIWYTDWGLGVDCLINFWANSNKLWQNYGSILVATISRGHSVLQTLALVQVLGGFHLFFQVSKLFGFLQQYRRWKRIGVPKDTSILMITMPAKIFPMQSFLLNA